MIQFLSSFKQYLFVLLMVCFIMVACEQSDKATRVLVFTKTKGFYHESIPNGIAALQKLGEENGFEVDTTKDATVFNEKDLKKYKAIIFLSTTGNVLNLDQQVAFERYIQAGGGYVGIHAAADTEYEWPWYNKLVGAYFMSHPNNPNVRNASIDIKDTTHLATRTLPLRWERIDEWYNYKNIYSGIKVLATLDENSYEGGENGEHHPIAWHHAYDGGRAFYTGGGHTKESYSEPLFLKHLLGGIQYVVGDNIKLDYAKAYAVKAPEENRFTKAILSNDLNEPMELAVASDGRVFFVERTGKFYMYDPASHSTKLLREFPVMQDSREGAGNGLLGVTLDPDFSSNHFIYFFYTPDKKPASQYISRFVIDKNGVLDLASEKIILEIPIELEVGAHTGGSLTWDKSKNLYISTGDNTVPFESHGFAPLDERPGRIIFDAQRSSGNTNDLRGKILRIHPEKDGSYTIPEGNLFAKGTPQTRPEIYAMGCRNPYRMSVDQETSIVYWGEIGPDAGENGSQGPRGYDEINQAKKAGNFGWPYFVGDNKPYYHFDFSTSAIGELYKAEAPANTSVNNTGSKVLPPAQKAMIWYPYAKSDEFTDIGTGGRSAMAGPVYHFDNSNTSSIKLPDYYDDALFIYEWMRNWVFVVRLDEDQNYKRLEPFMAVSGDFKRPIDLEVGHDGALYMLEYGSVYGIDNVDARLVRIEYNGGNRKPVARIATSDTVGLAPYKVKFNNASYDFDEEDKLTFAWTVDGKKSTDADYEYVFQRNGIYSAVLAVTDPAGQTSTDTVEIKVGNTLPTVSITTAQNSTFFFPSSSLQYAVQIQDAEDEKINIGNVHVALKYIPKVDQMVVGHQSLTSFNLGKSLMQSSDCKACHQIDGKSVGPAFTLVAQRYANDKNAPAYLANKIITGGGGVWGEHTMNAHPQLSKEDATEIVKYVLSLANQKSATSLPLQGSVALKEHKAEDIHGRYVIMASYTDNGGAIVPLTNTASLALRPARVQAEDADKVRNMEMNGKNLGSIHHRSHFVLKQVDLKGIKEVIYRYASKEIGATIEVHVNEANGPLISTVNYDPTGNWDNYKELKATIKDPGGKNDLYFVFKKEQEPNHHMASLDWIEFKQ